MRSKYKVVLLGDGGVGKTSLVKRFVHSKFDDKYLKTLGTNVYTKNIVIREDRLSNEVVMQIWDVLGQSSFKKIIRSALKGTQGIIFVSDLTDKSSLVNLQQWLYTSYQHMENASFIFLGNKSDLEEKRFELEDLNAYASAFNSKALLTSAKTGENVDRAFEVLSRMMVDEVRCPPKEKVKFPEFTEHVSPKIMAEDRMIDLFCQELGGYEISMPVVREQFKRLDIDFENPTKADLENLIDRFVEIALSMKGDDICIYMCSSN
jgi:small GTP-binding protein